MLSLESVAHRFGSRGLFESLDLVMNEGDVVFIVGPSGSGKSTLLSIIGGLFPPSAGTVTRSGGAVGWVLQDTTGLARRSVLDNARLFAEIDGDGRRSSKEQAESALSAVGLLDRRSACAQTLSGGENQRLCVARALACHRRLLLVDEPTSQLDRENAELVMSALSDEGLRRRTVVVVTHDVAAIPSGSLILSLGSDGLSRVAGSGA